MLVGLHSRAGETLCSRVFIRGRETEFPEVVAGLLRSAGRDQERTPKTEGRAPLLHAHFIYASSKRDPESRKT